MFRVKRMQWWGALVVTVWFSTAATVQAGTWTPLVNQPTFLNPPSQCALYPNANCAPPGNFSFGGVFAENLLTDGSVMVYECETSNWFKLTPDSSGNYALGTWSQLASLPDINGVAYRPLYFASAVLADGRLVITGGEYNFDNFAFTNQGAIYDPVKNTWTKLKHPKGWVNIGDSPSSMLPDGRFLLGR